MPFDQVARTLPPHDYDRPMRTPLAVTRLLFGVAFVLGSLQAPARADVVGPIPPCPAGSARGGSGMLDGMMMSHAGAPACEPAVCRDASTCGENQTCRTDAHCIGSRDVTDAVPSRGHGAPSSGRTVGVTRALDFGRCAEDGSCPADTRCMEVATCRADGELDVARVASSMSPPAGHIAAGAWSSARANPPPHTTAPADLAAAVLPTVEAPPAPSAEAAMAEPGAPIEAPVSAPIPAPAAPAGCSCGMGGRPPSSLGVLFVLVAGGVLVGRRRTLAPLLRRRRAEQHDVVDPRSAARRDDRRGARVARVATRFAAFRSVMVRTDEPCLLYTSRCV